MDITLDPYGVNRDVNPHDVDSRKAYKRQYYLANRERLLKISAEWREKNKEKKRLDDRRYYKENREKVDAVNRRYAVKNKEVIADYQQQYRCDNYEPSTRVLITKDERRAKKSAWQTKRRASKLMRTPSWANDDYLHLWYQFASMESKRTGEKVVVDHIIPLQGRLVSGLHCEHNLQLLFERDNSKKGNKYAI